MLTGHPLDTVKVRLQAEKSVYRGSWHAFTSIVKEEKVLMLDFKIRLEDCIKVWLLHFSALQLLILYFLGFMDGLWIKLL